uniref:ATP-dependent zinc metalloprotease YME1L1 (inferred by orthology to a human protein) n=1 Tax=Strongyloides venezuelensis TaxID=75913 RepID=A0A0K0EZ72_STRVS
MIGTMSFYGRIGHLLHRRSRVPGFFSPNKTLSIGLFGTEGGKRLVSGFGINRSGRGSKNTKSTKQKVFFPSFLKTNEKTTKPQNWNELKDELSKMPNDKKEVYLEAMLRGVLSMDKDILVKKPEKNKYSTIFKLFVLYFILFGIYKLVDLKVEFESSLPGFQKFLNNQKVRSTENIVTFDDVKGIDEAKTELMEVVEYLRDPKKYAMIGGKLPKGVLLVGPPGTGKTLLARAVAGEAKVPFFHKSGSEFEEILVGRGAARVRALFNIARKNAPCIIFIDEIDSIGSKRVTGGLHPYANQTINQLLTEMDGFGNSEGIIVIGATNRPKDLDKALLRPGRFDILVNCPKPDLPGRIEIFKHYLDKVVHKTIKIETLAKMTTGFSAADISNVVNQAALKAATEGCRYVMEKHIEDAIDRVIMGPARIKGTLPDKEVSENTAYHEAGHALVSLYTPHAIPLHKVTIIPRQNTLGHTSFIPEKDVYQVTRASILAQIDTSLGGRVAEELIFGKDSITTGAANDLEQATSLTKSFIRNFGMSENIGLRMYNTDSNDVSPQVTEKIDIEIDRIINESYERVKKILTERAIEHKRLAKALLEFETLTAEEVKSVIEGKPIGRKPTEKAYISEHKREKPSLEKSHPEPIVVGGAENAILN